MILKNYSSKIIGIGGTSFLPGESTECPKAYEKNPVVRKYMSNGIFTEVKPEKKRSGAQKTSGPAKPDEPVKDDVSAGAGSSGSENGTDDSAKQAATK